MFQQCGEIYCSIHVLDAVGTGSEPRLLVDRGESPSWSPDGERIAFVGPGGLELIRLDGSSREEIFARSFLAAPMTPRWSPDGRQLAFVVGSVGIGRIHIWDGNAVVPMPGAVNARKPTWSAMGTSLAYERISFLDDGSEWGPTAVSDIHLISLSGFLERVLVSGASAPSWSH